MNANEANIYVRKTVGGNAARLREERGVSQAALARMVEVNRPFVNQFENGKRNVSIDYLVKLADGLDVPVAEFFSGLEGSSPSELASKMQ